MHDPSIANTTRVPPAVTSDAVIGQSGVNTALNSPAQLKNDINILK